MLEIGNSGLTPEILGPPQATWMVGRVRIEELRGVGASLVQYSLFLDYMNAFFWGPVLVFVEIKLCLFHCFTAL